MGIIYNYLKNVFQDIKQETKQNPSFVGAILILTTIPASLAINNTALILLCASVFLNLKKPNFKISKALILLLLLYFLMLFSLLWTIDVKQTLKALPKEIALLLIPTAFIFISNFTKEQKTKLFKYYSHGMLLWTFYWIVKASANYIITKDSAVFFYHELVTKDVNAIHVSIYISIAFFYFLISENRSLKSNLILSWLFFFLILLASKNVLITFIGLLLFYIFRYSKLTSRAKSYYIFSLFIALFVIFSFGKVRNRFEMEIAKNFSYVKENPANKREGVNTINVAEAWNKEMFSPSDYFPGTAMRVYKFRIFLELLKEEPIFWKGYGLNASKIKLKEKDQSYNLHSGYAGFNFHNQYIQNFAELGIFGFTLLLLIVILNLKNSIKSKDFLHIVFGILMITLFLTESFLWRQRGVMFFTILYCIFNTTNYVKHTKTELKIP